MNIDGSNVVRLTDDPAKDADPAWSPDGTRITWATERDNNKEIYIMNSDGSGKRNLTDHPSADYGVTQWSPDGEWIAFISNRTGNYDVYVVHPGGSNAINLTNSPARECCPAWQKP